MVSIIIPAYNAEKKIKNSIKSLMNQTYKNIEIIIVNDGSTDRTGQICSELMKCDNRIKMITIENSGVSNARNVGIAQAVGEFITFLDADDIMESEMVEKLRMSYDDSVDLVCCGHKIVDEKGKFLFEKKPSAGCWDVKCYYEAIEELQKANCFNMMWNKMFRASVIKGNMISLDNNISMGEDYLFNMQYLKYCKGLFIVISDSLYFYALTSNGLQAKFHDGMDLRLSQLDALFKFYEEKKYPLNGAYLESLRVLYVLILEAENSDDIIRKIFLTQQYKELIRADIVCSGKYKLFLTILKTGKSGILFFAVRCFKALKMISGRMYRW